MATGSLFAVKFRCKSRYKKGPAEITGQKSSDNPVKIQYSPVKGQKKSTGIQWTLEVSSEISIPVIPHRGEALLKVQQDLLFTLAMEVKIADFLVFMQERAQYPRLALAGLTQHLLKLLQPIHTAFVKRIRVNISAWLAHLRMHNGFKQLFVEFRYLISLCGEVYLRTEYLIRHRFYKPHHLLSHRTNVHRTHQVAHLSQMCVDR